MRCPYCGGLNQERAAFCVNCGRDLVRGASPQRQQPAQTPYATPARPANQPNHRGANPQPRTQQEYPPASRRPANQPAQSTVPANRRQTQAASPLQTPIMPVQPAPEPPGPFPPRNMSQFTALLAAGSQQYTILERVESNGRKSNLRIAYPDCANWQQAATLLKALQEQSTGKFDTIIIQGFSARQPNATAFNQGQLQFDRNVILGGQRNNRYIVETGNGFASDAVRFVLNE